jgi:hypothetical protein
MGLLSWIGKAMFFTTNSKFMEEIEIESESLDHA